MNENFEKDTNETTENPVQEPEKKVEPQRVNEPKAPPYGQPSYGNYGSNNYYGNSGNYGNTNQYMPYGNYSAYNRPEAEKRTSKGKKKGVMIAGIILGVSLLIAVAVFLAALFTDGKNNITHNGDDDTQIDFSETPDSNGYVSDGSSMSSKEIYQKVHESSVGIIVYSGNRQQASSEGSGVVLGLNRDKTGSYIITCAHVIDVSNPKIVVQVADGTQYDAIIVGADSKTDIGLLYVANTTLKAAEFANSDTLEVGDAIYAIGNPGGTQFFGSFTNGMVSAIGRPVDSPVGYEVSCIQHTAAINPGNSGGALVNSFGQIVGINSSKIASTEFEGMGFAVPSSTVKEIVDQLIENGRVTNRPALGIQFMPVTKSQTYSIIVKTNDLPSGSIIIDTIMNGSDLQNTDVKEGDMIIAVNGADLDDYNMLSEAIENGNVGDTLTLEICRVDSNYKISTFEVKVKLVEDSSLSEPQEEYETQTFPFPFSFGD